jgi:hypothetical protein
MMMMMMNIDKKLLHEGNASVVQGMKRKKQNTQELAPLFICWVTLAYTAVRRKVSAVC